MTSILKSLKVNPISPAQTAVELSLFSMQVRKKDMLAVI